MKKARAFHSICWHEHRERVIVFGGLVNVVKEDSSSIEPTSSLEIGAKEQVDGQWVWVWSHLKELEHPRLNASICTTERYLFVFGGFVLESKDSVGYQNMDLEKDLESSNNNKIIRAIERYDFSTNKAEKLCTISDSFMVYNKALCFSNKGNSIIIFGGTRLGKKDSDKRVNPSDRAVLLFDTEACTYREICTLEKIDTPADAHNRCVSYLHNIELLVTAGSEHEVAILKYDLSRETIEYASCKE